MVTLADREESAGEIGHLPADTPLTGRQFIEMVFQELGRPPRMALIRRPMMYLAGLVSPMIRESLEVLYQFEAPFVMDWSKFRQAFSGRVTPLRDAIRETLEALRHAHRA